ncbi:hypothetical protein [Chryseobacterium sp. BIGb0232]|uniref:hypothetical protein n=1 Tax=Chryseobacterium sp. BIGb0232 TaxID=2940598 RepID=UPI000F48F148|nr:hypothetical protein [Chryseobacterium sp. BIGb0232]MCS4302121.1 hypothetical protein [Chryseobacterium sp. BIGb0232]ROS18067.1 hypothetical protein EDF65_2457 [Chryseobacterium nakagawai]
MEIVRDIVCQVYAGEKSKNIIDLVLDTFIPDYEKLNTDYTFPPNNKDYVFTTEIEMISYFIENKGLNQTFYWNKSLHNPYRIMVGANITDDDKLVMSLTLDASLETGEEYLNKLKEVLQSNIGVISFVNPMDYENGEDFVLRYQKSTQYH